VGTRDPKRRKQARSEKPTRKREPGSGIKQATLCSIPSVAKFDFFAAQIVSVTGESIAEFCRDNGLSKKDFTYWRRGRPTAPGQPAGHSQMAKEKRLKIANGLLALSSEKKPDGRKRPVRVSRQDALVLYGLLYDVVPHFVRNPRWKPGDPDVFRDIPNGGEVIRRLGGEKRFRI
jgi:hypothetical protein